VTSGSANQLPSFRFSLSLGVISSIKPLINAFADAKEENAFLLYKRHS
jgi:hypothetical protein